MQKTTIVKWTTFSRTCPDCKGSGYDAGDGGQCDTCDGTGEV